MNGLVFFLFLEKTIHEQPVLIHVVHLGFRSETDTVQNPDPETWLDDPAGAGWLFDNCLFDCLQDLRVVLYLEVVFGQGFCVDCAGSGRWFSNRWPCLKGIGHRQGKSLCDRSVVGLQLLAGCSSFFFFFSLSFLFFSAHFDRVIRSKERIAGTEERITEPGL